MNRACCAIAVAAAACTFSRGQFGDGIDAAPTICSASEIGSTCAGDTLRTCTVVGQPAQERACGWGCVAAQPAHCRPIMPAGGAMTSDDLGGAAGLGDIVLDATTCPSGACVVNGLQGTITGVAGGFAHRAVPAVGNGVGVFRVRSLRLVAGTSLVLAGPYAIAFAAEGEIGIEGLIEARGGCRDTGLAGQTAGAGGYPGGDHSVAPPVGQGGGTGSVVDTSGGGGGGYGGVGGAGAPTAGAAGGPMFGASEIPILVGGGGGGGGKGGNDNSYGGGGGGALQLVSNVSVRIADSGGINAGGCGGTAGGGANDSGGGGGAGGTILIEAPAIEIAGRLAVNGGGGGGGGGGSAKDGNPGTLARTLSSGGDGDTSDGDTAGGAGAAAAVANGFASATSAVAAPKRGGGGGAIGRIRFTTHNMTGLDDANAMLSPARDDHTTCTHGATVLAP